MNKNEVLPLSQFKDGWLDEYYDDADQDSYPLRENEGVIESWMKGAMFLPRPDMEKNEDFKQFIPYCIIRQNDKIFCYKRTKKGGEKRLHELYSLGVGGHISLEDATCVDVSTKKTMPMIAIGLDNGIDYCNKGLRRELLEEVGLEEKNYTVKLIGAIYDDSTPVNRVHLGLVYVVDIDSNIELKTTDHALSNGGFETLASLKKNMADFESWSQIVIKNGALDG